MKNKLIAIGELLIDFIPLEVNKKLKDVKSFSRVAGGAPANVCVCVSKLGIKSVMLTQVGDDAFGDFLINTLNDTNVDTLHILKTKLANTALAFVSIDQHGERDFTFYRNPSADLLYDELDIDQSLFNKNDVLHFCSVDLIDSPMKLAHIKAIEYAIKQKMIISFDPNLRFPLWHDHIKYRETILEFIPKAHILKISEDELSFITQIDNQDLSIKSLFQGNVKVVILTKGSNGACMYTKDYHICVPSIKASAVDTTGAGDSFIGAIIFQILNHQINLSNLEQIVDIKTLEFAHKVSAHVVSKYGAIPAMPTLVEIS